MCSSDLTGSIARYLAAIHDEACRRGYRFDRSKLGRPAGRAVVTETRGQLMHEWAHLLRKLRRRDPALHRRLGRIRTPEPHPMFRIVPGPVRPWERLR